MSTEPTNTPSSSNSTIAKLFKTGSHFGFMKRRRHPTVRPYLYGTKDGNDIFDLSKTAACLEQATAVVHEYAKLGKTVLYVGTKDEARQLVTATATELGAPYVTNRWIGGTLTNFSEIKKRINRLSDLEAEQAAGTLDRKYTKRERVVLGREMDKLRFNFGGIQTMQRLPDLIVVVDPRFEEIAVEEANLLNIPIVGITSSDGDISAVTHPVVMNDALRASISFALEQLAAAQKAGAAAFTPAPSTRPQTTRPRSSASARTAA